MSRAGNMTRSSGAHHTVNPRFTPAMDLGSSAYDGPPNRGTLKFDSETTAHELEVVPAYLDLLGNDRPIAKCRSKEQVRYTIQPPAAYCTWEHCTRVSAAQLEGSVLDQQASQMPMRVVSFNSVPVYGAPVTRCKRPKK